MLEESRHIETLIKQARSGTPEEKLAAVEGLAERANGRAISGLVYTLRDVNPIVVRRTAELLGTLGRPAVRPLVEALSEADLNLSAGAVKALAAIGSPALPLLIKALGDENERIRWCAVWALGEIGDPTAVPPLVELLEDTGRPEPLWDRMCDMAAKALEKIGTPTGLEAVKEWRESEPTAEVKRKRWWHFGRRDK
jgi:HEAT repeat protein